MGWFDYSWNLAQSARIDELEDKVETLESKIEEMSKWILMLKEQLDGERKAREFNQEPTVVETPKGLEASLLEDRT